MKATGIIRKMDDLGRVVIPMEIRKNLMINEDDMFEFFVEGDLICLKRHFAIDGYCSLAKLLAKEVSTHKAHIANADEVKKLLDKAAKLLQA